MEGEYSQDDEEFKNLNKIDLEEESKEEHENENNGEEKEKNITRYNIQEFEIENIIIFFLIKIF